MRPWDSIISDEEQRAYHAAGFGRPSGTGASLEKSGRRLPAEARRPGSTRRSVFS